MNNDGYADVIVGADRYNSWQGRAYVYIGTVSGVHATPSVTLTGEVGSAFGYSVGTAGDVNNDGYADVIVGANQYSSDTGRAYLYHGGVGGLSATPSVTLIAENSGDYFGYSVGTAGDVNNDSYADVIVGAVRYNSNQGRAYVYMGEAVTATPVPTLTEWGTFMLISLLAVYSLWNIRCKRLVQG